MDLYKEALSQKFNKASTSYDSVATVQKESAHILVNLFKDHASQFEPQSILDVGTGTDIAAAILSKHFPKSVYTLNDIAPAMLKIAVSKLDGYDFNLLLGDIEQLSFSKHDLIISNFSLQWSTNLLQTVKKLYHNTHCLAFSCLLSNTFYEWSNLFQQLSLPIPTPIYPSYQALTAFLLSLNPKSHAFHQQSFTLHFASAHHFMMYLKQLGAQQGGKKIGLNDLKKILNHYPKALSVT